MDIVRLEHIPYRDEVEDCCQRILSKVKTKSIVLFGSMARGDFGLGSDVDILLIGENLPQNFSARLRILSDLNPTWAPIEIFGYTPEEFLRMVEKRHPTALDALEDGILLNDDGFFQEMKNKFEEIKHKLRLTRTRHGWMAETIIEEFIK